MKTTTKLFADLEAKYLASLIPRRTQEIQTSGNTLVSATDVTEIEIQSNIVAIAEGSSTDYVFQGSTETLTKVSFQEGSQLTTIGSYSFYYCTKLESIDLTQCTKLKIINTYAFGNCYSLQHFELPQSVTSIDDNSFRNTPIETTFSLSNIDYLASNSFVNTSLSFTCSTNNQILSEYKNNIYNKNFSILRLVSFSTQILKIHPNTITIYNIAFSSSSLEEIILPQQISTLGQWVFHLNNHIKSITLSFNNIKTTENSFLISYLPNLEIVHIVEGTKEIPTNFISHCDKLKIIHFPKSLQIVTSKAFNVPSLKYVTYQRSQYFMLLNGGIPRSALIHSHSHCSLHSFSFSRISLLLFITI